MGITIQSSTLVNSVPSTITKRRLSAAAQIRAAIHAETYAGLSLELILTKAQVRVANHIENADGVDALDPFLHVSEDEYGDLVHTQGDLSVLMPAAH
jgi:hypothetical protein